MKRNIVSKRECESGELGETPTKKIFFSRAIERRMSETMNDSLGTNHFSVKQNLGFSARIDFTKSFLKLSHEPG